ncbi:MULTISPECIES: TetR/AcrR family transcriptional regulator [Amycolatopsis]|uniref:TetR/AcrR family transcriptional regulator n=1 Tax=Amycolatopsis TaxID=1813 RepID=UPI000B8AC9D1|nr:MULTISPECIES: TetR/AcrR family transcriptional regulator [Amycolatopsis]OXM72691.1 TetR family transcriptional regulator [Amycolatopsis sp. KNN50.9b]
MIPVSPAVTAVPYGRPVESVNARVREPKQERSRLSFDKALDAVIALLVERRSDSFTLADVAQRAGVSTGSIYGRVSSKDDLIRTAHAREMERIGDEQRAAFAEPAPAGETFGEAVERVIGTAAELLRRNAPVLGPFMLLANTDAQIAELGGAAHAELREAFVAALAERADEISHPEPRRALEWSFTVVYSVLARWLALGSTQQASGEGEWSGILADLARMVLAFLTQPAAPRKSRRR